jgi:hemerythrin
LRGPLPLALNFSHDTPKKAETAETHTHSPALTIYSMLDELMVFTDTHFTAEERLMRRVEYPPAPMEEMLGQHGEFKDYARMQVLEFRQDEGVSVLPLLTDLTRWLVTHEFGLDRKLVDWIRENQPGQLT